MCIALTVSACMCQNSHVFFHFQCRGVCLYMMLMGTPPYQPEATAGIAGLTLLHAKMMDGRMNRISDNISTSKPQLCMYVDMCTYIHRCVQFLGRGALQHMCILYVDSGTRQTVHIITTAGDTCAMLLKSACCKPLWCIDICTDNHRHLYSMLRVYVCAYVDSVSSLLFCTTEPL